MLHQPVTRARTVLAAILTAIVLLPTSGAAQSSAPERATAAQAEAQRPEPVSGTPAGTTMGTGAALSLGSAPVQPLAARQPAAALTRRVDRQGTDIAAPLPRQEDSNRANTALMIVGAAAVLVGAAVGDEAGTVLIIGGAGIGLWGLYRFLN